LQIRAVFFVKISGPGNKNANAGNKNANAGNKY
jgi:hypothetical protein